ncbi:MAG: hypothetical protein V1858_01605 [Candidatus Gottesmanbacteria bacterium]
MKISCPGKIILMGEHAVVYGKPAIVAAVNRRMILRQAQDKQKTITKVRSEIPIGCGMGSSAAWSVLLAANQIFSTSGIKKLNEKILAKISKLAYEFEKVYHGNPSGADTTVITYGGILWFKKLKNHKFIFNKLKIGSIRKFVLINSGKPKESTRDMVEKVKLEKQKNKKRTENLLDMIGEQTKIFLHGLETRNRRLIKDSVQNCESLLEDLGVVGQQAKDIIGKIEAIGGAAKITGAGGISTGSGMLLCYHQDPQKILDLAKKLKLDAFKVKLGTEGVKIEC